MKNKATIYLGSLLAAVIVIGACSLPEMSGTWTTASSEGFGNRCWATACPVDGKIYVIGGYGDSLLATTLDVYNPSTNKWSQLNTKGTFTQRASLASCNLNGKIYVFGGATGPEQPSAMSNALEVFDPATNTWSTPKTKGSLAPRNNLCACVVRGKIYTLGGYTAESPGDVNTLEMFDPATNTWSVPETKGSFTPHGAFTANVVNNKIYAIGGYNDKGTKGHRVLSTVEVFDPATNTWSAPATTGTFRARLLHTSGVVDGKIYVIGGTPDVRNPLTTDLVQVFDPATNAWSTPATTGTFTPRAYLSGAVVNNKIYVIGGQDTSQVFNKIEVLTPSRKNG